MSFESKIGCASEAIGPRQSAAPTRCTSTVWSPGFHKGSADAIGAPKKQAAHIRNKAFCISHSNLRAPRTVWWTLARRWRGTPYHIFYARCASQQIRPANDRFWSIAAEMIGTVQRLMSALPPKADIATEP